MSRKQPQLRLILAVGFLFWSASVQGAEIALQGLYSNADPNAVIGAGNSGRLSADATFNYWGPKTWSQNVDLGGFTFTHDTGNGNQINYQGAFSGTGNIVTVGGSSHSEFWPFTLGGSTPNTYAGSFTIKKGTVVLNKPSGVTAVTGPLILGGGAAPANIQWNASNQINDTATLTTTGAHRTRFWMQGYNETLGSLTLQADFDLEMGDGASVVRFAASGDGAWTAGKQLLVKNWNGSLSGGSGEQVYFGVSNAGLTAGQLAQVGFTNPAGKSAGLYRAQILASGEIVPADDAVQAINPPFDLSTAAQAVREAIYASDGRANLSGANTPLAAGAKISFFGDSITWQNGYIAKIQAALNEGAGTKNLGVQLINRGINGGTAKDVRDGKADSAYPGSSAQGSFADVVTADGAQIAVVSIGINDVWWAGTTEADFRQTLRDIADTAAQKGVKLVLATPGLRGELPDGSNAQDAAIDAFAQITRDVAAEKHVTLVDLRKVEIAYLQNNNWDLNLDGSLTFQSTGILTYDGVHPTDLGNNFLADHLAQGVFSAASVPEPKSLVSLLAGGILLGCRVWRQSAGNFFSSTFSHWLPLLCCGVCLLAFGPGRRAVAQSTAVNLVPYPTSVTVGTGSLALTSTSRIVISDSSLGAAGGVLSNEIFQITGSRLPVYQGAARDGDIVLRLDSGLTGESYTYAVGNQAVVSANNYQSLALASTTVVQSLTSAVGTWSLPKVQIADAPSASFRSTMLDLAREPHSIDSIKQQISLNRLYKIPYVQLHLTDDQAFTFEQNSVSGLNGHNYQGAKDRRTMPTYTQQELRELVIWADQRGVTLIPEIEMPGHGAQLVSNRPDLFRTGWYHHATANIANPAAVAALKNIVGEVAGVFASSPYIHIGGDEADYSQLAYGLQNVIPGQGGNQPTVYPEVRAQWDAKMDALGDRTPDAVFRDFANQMNDYIKSLGKQTIVWESPSIRSASVPVDKDILVMAYENWFHPNVYINAGFEVINASWSPLYIVGHGGAGPGLSDSVQDIYNWDKTWFDVYYGNQTPTSADHVTSNTDKILGAQMCLWENTEASELGVARLRVAAMAEKLWNPDSGLSFDDFLARLTAVDTLLESMILADAMALPTVVPEPSALTLAAVALGLLLLRRRWRAK